MSLDKLAAGTFSAVGSSSAVTMVASDRMYLRLRGTFVANVTIEEQVGSSAWKPLAGKKYGETGVYVYDVRDGRFRVTCTSYTSGTVQYELRGIGETPYHRLPGWDDLRFPATGLNPPGLVSDPDIDSDDGLPLFDAASTELMTVLAQMPHGWVEGSKIIPHVHWTKTTSASGNVLWRFEYQVANVGDAFPGSWTQIDATSTVPGTPDNNNANEHLISSFGTLDMSGCEISCILKMRISRVGGDASDTYGADAKLLEFDIHYERDSDGSGGEFYK